MSDVATPRPTDTAGALYGEEYYHSHCGDMPYTADSPIWKEFYGRVADEIVRTLAPVRAFDAGCAIGFLVAALWDRGVETRGRDISPFAISQVRPDVRAYCSVGSIADPIDGEVDLVLCIEVLEHMPEADALAAIANLTSVAPRILFSSTSSDFDEPTHINVRPAAYWLQEFGRCGFVPVTDYDASFLCPHAMLLERRTGEAAHPDLVAFAEILRQRELRADTERKAANLTRLLAEAQSEVNRAREDFARAEAQLRRRALKAEGLAAAVAIGVGVRMGWRNWPRSRSDDRR